MVEYDESKKEFKNGSIKGTRTTKIPKMSDSQDPKPPEDKPIQDIIHTVVAAAASPNSAKRYAKSSTPKSSEEEHEDSQK